MPKAALYLDGTFYAGDRGAKLSQGHLIYSNEDIKQTSPSIHENATLNPISSSESEMTAFDIYVGNQTIHATRIGDYLQTIGTTPGDTYLWWSSELDFNLVHVQTKKVLYRATETHTECSEALSLGTENSSFSIIPRVCSITRNDSTVVITFRARWWGEPGIVSLVLHDPKEVSVEDHVMDLPAFEKIEKQGATGFNPSGLFRRAIHQLLSVPMNLIAGKIGFRGTQ
jgi:cell wall-associated NlpC family hydrolase